MITKNMTPRRFNVGIMMSLLVGTCLVGAPLHASPSAVHTPGAQSLSAGSHCVAEAVATPVGSENMSALTPPTTPAVTCFANFSDAIQFATHGTVQLAADAAPSQLSERQLAFASNYVIGIEYEHPDFGGSSMTFTSTFSCEQGYVLTAYGMPAGWNDRISSSMAFSGCNHSYHYEHSNLRGASVDCGTECDFLGWAMGDRTSSIQWTP